MKLFNIVAVALAQRNFQASQPEETQLGPRYVNYSETLTVYLNLFILPKVTSKS